MLSHLPIAASGTRRHRNPLPDRQRHVEHVLIGALCHGTRRRLLSCSSPGLLARDLQTEQQILIPRLNRVPEHPLQRGNQVLQPKQCRDRSPAMHRLPKTRKRNLRSSAPLPRVRCTAPSQSFRRHRLRYCSSRKPTEFWLSAEKHAPPARLKERHPRGHGRPLWSWRARASRDSRFFLGREGQFQARCISWLRGARRGFIGGWEAADDVGASIGRALGEMWPEVRSGAEGTLARRRRWRRPLQTRGRLFPSTTTAEAVWRP